MALQKVADINFFSIYIEFLRKKFKKKKSLNPFHKFCCENDSCAFDGYLQEAWIPIAILSFPWA